LEALLRQVKADEDEAEGRVEGVVLGWGRDIRAAWHDRVPAKVHPHAYFGLAVGQALLAFAGTAIDLLETEVEEGKGGDRVWQWISVCLTFAFNAMAAIPLIYHRAMSPM
jgi:hypothetical protein